LLGGAGVVTVLQQLPRALRVEFGTTKGPKLLAMGPFFFTDMVVTGISAGCHLAAPIVG